MGGERLGPIPLDDMPEAPFIPENQDSGWQPIPLEEPLPDESPDEDTEDPSRHSEKGDERGSVIIGDDNDPFLIN